MMTDREKLRRKRERLQLEREQRRRKLLGLIWGLVTILVVSSVLFVGFFNSDGEASAATNENADKSLDPSFSIDGTFGSSPLPPPYSLGFIELGSVNPPVRSGKGCKADMRWPVLPHVVIRRFKAPKTVWGPGHRGVDIAAVEDTPLLAPASGFISFAGIVAGKSVVSIRHKSLTLTLEPAQTLLPIGTPVVKGMPIGVVKGLSDHCTGICVHWGVRKSRKEYRDPQQLATKRKIVLKSVLP